MSTEHKLNLQELFPLPEGIKLRTHKFGANPVTALAPVPVRGDLGDSSGPRAPFQLRWEDEQLGLTVIVREHDNGHLIADVSCADVGLLNKGSVSVGLVGSVESEALRKTIPLDIPERDGCRGSWDFGPLAYAARQLGSPLGLVVVLLV